MCQGSRVCEKPLQAQEYKGGQGVHVCEKPLQAPEWDPGAKEEEANRKRSEAAKAQHEVSKPRAGEHKPEPPVMVGEQSVHAPKHEEPEEDSNSLGVRVFATGRC